MYKYTCRYKDIFFNVFCVNVYMTDFSHTQRVSVTSDHPVSVVVVVVVVVVSVNFFSFSTSSLEPFHGSASNFVRMFLRWTPTKFVKVGVQPVFFMEL